MSTDHITWAEQIGAAAREERAAVAALPSPGLCPVCLHHVNLTRSGRLPRHDGCDYSDRKALPAHERKVERPFGKVEH